MGIGEGTSRRLNELPADADLVILVRNPSAGTGLTGEVIDRLCHELVRRGLTVDVVTDLNGLAAAVLRGLDRGRLRTVVAAGGDGTAETVVNLLPAAVPLTVLPLGTENLLAKYLGMTCDADAVARAIVTGRTLRMDTGEVRARDDAPSRTFLLMMGCGFDAEVIRRLHQTRKGNITHFSYAKPIFDAIQVYDYPKIRVTCHESMGGPAVHTIDAHWAFVFNTPSYAVGLGICPDADPFDRQLDLITFRGGSFFQGLLHLGSVLVGRHRLRRSVQAAKVTCVRISSERPVPVQLDGDPWGELPVAVSIQPGRLTVVVPPEWTNRGPIR